MDDRSFRLGDRGRYVAARTAFGIRPIFGPSVRIHCMNDDILYTENAVLAKLMFEARQRLLFQYLLTVGSLAIAWRLLQDPNQATSVVAPFVWLIGFVVTPVFWAMDYVHAKVLKRCWWVGADLETQKNGIYSAINKYYEAPPLRTNGKRLRDIMNLTHTWILAVFFFMMAAGFAFLFYYDLCYGIVAKLNQ